MTSMAVMCSRSSACVKDFLPNAVRCVDFFHVVEWANQALDKVRVSTANKALREYNQRKSELMQLAESAERIRKDALQELESMPKRGRPSKRKQELMETLRKLDEFTAQQDTQVPGSSKLEQASADLDNLQAPHGKCRRQVGGDCRLADAALAVNSQFDHKYFLLFRCGRAVPVQPGIKKLFCIRRRRVMSTVWSCD